jgi:alanine racemase
MRLKSKFIVYLNRLKKNFERLREIAPQNKIIFMVKSNAYGHGIFPLVEYAVDEIGVEEFGVATLGEALALREEFPEKKFEIYVFSDVDLQSDHHQSFLDQYLNKRIIPVLSSWEDFEFVIRSKEAKFLPLVIKVDTGMNRLGLNLEMQENLERLIRLLEENGRKEIFHLMTHFSSAGLDVKKNKRTQNQYQEFLRIKKALLDKGFLVENSSVSNSGAIEQGFGLDESHIRPGLMLYGPSAMIPPLRELSPWRGANLSQLSTNIVNVKKVKKGDVVGYGAHVLDREGILIHIALGYGDGLVTWYQGCKLQVNGFEGQFVGRVNMDLAALLFPLESEGHFKVGDSFSLWNEKTEEVTRLSDQMQTIPYQLFTCLNSRLPREYRLE